MGLLHSATRDLARALSPHSRGLWLLEQRSRPTPIISVPLAACGKAHFECRLAVGEALQWRVYLACVPFGEINLDLT